MKRRSQPTNTTAVRCAVYTQTRAADLRDVPRKPIVPPHGEHGRISLTFHATGIKSLTHELASHQEDAA